MGLHQRVRRLRGPANLDECQLSRYGDDCSPRLEWANVSGRYIDTDDFMVLCKHHHKLFDKGRSRG